MITSLLSDYDNVSIYILTIPTRCTNDVIDGRKLVSSHVLFRRNQQIGNYTVMPDFFFSIYCR